jgi:3-methylcrotonyl-CoA carboxylase alpha subunit
VSPMRTVLVANRGEIAVRIIRACRELGVRSVAVYAEPDRDAPHVLLADGAVPLGGADPESTYLSIPRILEAARRAGADMVHPGYGFLAESAEFAAAVRDAGYTFVGPPPEAMARLGHKGNARRLARRCGIPVVPGYDGGEEAPEAFLEAARRLGYPLLVKAAAGGGGRGMRLVAEERDLPEALEGARREARSAFGEGALILERYLGACRHVEVQVLADTRGTVVSLGERECSVQRRHQKVVEEAPSPGVSPDLRERLGEAATALLREAGYVNAGTVEFLLDGDGRFYFLEVNTRLQVEHPVTEATTGVDLVGWQLRIAMGEPLPPDPPAIRGHAIECRVYAEDPAREFQPSPGPIDVLVEPSGPGIRVDSGIRAGFRVPAAYDPLLAKVIAWDLTREGAIRRMARALRDYVLLGCRTNLEFLQAVIGHEAFRRGETTTRFLAEHFAGWRPPLPEVGVVALAALEVLRGEAPARPAGRDRPSPRGGTDPWEAFRGWRMGAGRA